MTRKAIKYHNIILWESLRNLVASHLSLAAIFVFNLGGFVAISTRFKVIVSPLVVRQESSELSHIRV